MMTKSDLSGSCCSEPKKGIQTFGVMIQPSMNVRKEGQWPFQDLDQYRKPGYRLCGFVEGFLETEAGPAPRIKTSLDREDMASAILVRLGVNRNDYKVSPGLYAVGNPRKDSEVLVTANYKLTFDLLRKELQGLNCWILVLDTNGVNVWCAAGKKTFATWELVNRINKTRLDQVVAHKRLILPQLGATGISAGAVKKASGFSVIYGPVRAKDIPAFLENNQKADAAMRRVTFSFFERLVLTPIELRMTVKPALVAAIAMVVLSGIGPEAFSLSNIWARGRAGLFFLMTGIVSGALVTPALLPMIPFKAFAAKGFVSGALFAVLPAALISPGTLKPTGFYALWMFCMAVSSYLAMNFTGATPFTSPSGVEKEMKRYLPVQALGLVGAVALWVYSSF
jgi:hypothetical protein